MSDDHDPLDPRWAAALRRHASAVDPSDQVWDEIVARADGGRPRARALLAAVAVVVLLAGGLAVVLVARGSGDGPEGVRTVGSTPSRTARGSTEVDRCFDPLAARSPVQPARTTGAWPGDPNIIYPYPAPKLPGRVLALTMAGDVLVVDRQGVTTWSRGRHYLWAQWSGGSILASRQVHGTDVEFDRIRRPGEVALVHTFHNTVKRAAPKGYCPIDGHLATFSASSRSVIVAEHGAGPINHSCPSPGPACWSPQGVGFEVRTLDLARRIRSAGPAILSAKTTSILGGSVAAASPFLVRTGSSTEVDTVRGGACCYEVASPTGALSPDGRSFAWVYRDRSVRITDVSSLAGFRHVTPVPWRTSDRIAALAWGDGYLYAMHGRTLTVVSLTAGDRPRTTDVARLPPIRVLDAKP